MENRDERFIAPEAAVKSAEKKLRNAEIDVLDIQNKIKNGEESFFNNLAEKSEKYKSQTGAELHRNEDKAPRKIKFSFRGSPANKSQAQK